MIPKPFNASFRVRGKKHIVQLRVSHNGLLFEKSLNYSIGDSSNWDFKRNKLKPKGKHHSVFFANWTQAVNELSNKYQAKYIIVTNDKLWKDLQCIVQGEAITDTNGKRIPTLIEFIEHWLNDESKHFQLKGSLRKKLAYNTIRNKKQLLRVLRSFCKDVREVDFKDMDLVFYESFYSYCINTKGYAHNTFGGFIKNLKIFLQEAEESTILVNQGFKKRKFAVIQEPADTNKAIALPLNDIKLIAELELDNRMSIYRDWFIIGCFTGFRISDLLKLDRSHLMQIDRALHVKVLTQKTGIEVVQKVPEVVKKILATYGNSFPPKVTQQKFNLHIKTIARKAELGYWQKVSSHCMRRSFCTNAYLESPNKLNEIMMLSGHSKINNFLKYINITCHEHQLSVRSVSVLHKWQ